MAECLETNLFSSRFALGNEADRPTLPEPTRIEGFTLKFTALVF